MRRSWKSAGGKENRRSLAELGPTARDRANGQGSFEKRPTTFEISLSPKRRPLAGEEELFLKIQRVIVQGPLGGEQKEFAKGYRMIFVDCPRPEADSGRERYARKIMRSFVSRAFRRPSTTRRSTA